jgi:hypothetical protein
MAKWLEACFINLSGHALNSTISHVINKAKSNPQILHL